MANPMPPPLSALEVRLGLTEGSLEGEDKARAEAALDDAATLVLAEVSPAIADRWTANAHPVAVLVCLKAARREFDNPQGASAETYGEHTVSLSNTSGVYLTAREVAQLQRAATGRKPFSAGTIRTPSAYE